MSLAPSGRIKFLVTGMRGQTFADVARASGAFGADADDTDAEVSQKFANYAIQQNPNLKGDAGPTGPANSTYSTVAALRAAPTTNMSAILTATGLEGLFTWRLGDYSRVIDSRNAIASNGTAATIGAWIRVRYVGTIGNSFDVMGDSTAQAGGIGNRSIDPNFPALASYFSNRATVGINAAVSGYTTNNLIADQLPVILANGAAQCIIAVGTNDIATGFDGIEAGITPAQTRLNMVIIDTALARAGIDPVWMSLTPRNVTPTGPAAIPGVVAKTQALNAWLREYCRLNRRLFIDRYSMLVNPLTGEYASGYSDDGVHPNFLAIPYQAQLFVEAMEPKWQASGFPLVRALGDTDNLAANGLFTIDTNSDGVPDNWTKQSGSTNFGVGLITPSGAPGKAMRLYNLVGGNATGTVRSATVTTGFAVGDRLGWGFRAICNGPTVGAGVNGIGGNSLSLRYSVRRTYVGATSNGTLSPLNAWQASLIDSATVWVEDTVPPGTTGYYDEVAIDNSQGSFDIMQYTTRKL